MNKPTNLQKLKDKALQDPKVKDEYEKLKQIEEDIDEALKELMVDTKEGIGIYAVECIVSDVLEEYFPSDIKVNTEVLEEDSRLMEVGVEIPFSRNPKI